MLNLSSKNKVYLWSREVYHLIEWAGSNMGQLGMSEFLIVLVIFTTLTMGRWMLPSVFSFEISGYVIFFYWMMRFLTD